MISSLQLDNSSAMSSDVMVSSILNVVLPATMGMMRLSPSSCSSMTCTTSVAS